MKHEVVEFQWLARGALPHVGTIGGFKYGGQGLQSLPNRTGSAHVNDLLDRLGLRPFVEVNVEQAVENNRSHAVTDEGDLILILWVGLNACQQHVEKIAGSGMMLEPGISGLVMIQHLKPVRRVK